MKRFALCCLATLVLLSATWIFVFAAPEGPVITLQPQSPTYSQYSVAIYTVKVDGTNLSATWYMEWQDKTYTISEIGGAMQPWEPYAGESYGARKLDDHTFAFVFEGIEYDMDGAYIWCVIEDGHYDVTTQKTRVSVGEFGTPPEIISIPAQLTVSQGDPAELRCVAKAPEDTQLSYCWYETETGKRADIFAVNEGAETSDFLVCDTTKTGTRNYLCQVSTSDNGIAYSSIVPVTVTEKATQPTETPEQNTQPEVQTQPAETNEETLAATAPTSAIAPEQTEASAAVQNDTVEGIPWWVLLLIGIVAAGGGAGVAVLLTRKNKK